MLKAEIQKYTLQFKFEAGTSRGVLRERETWFIKIWDDNRPEIVGIGEAGPLKGISLDDVLDFEKQLSFITSRLLVEGKLVTSNRQLDFLPSIRFGIETALLDLGNGGRRIVFNNKFSLQEAPIPINGLIWMGSKEFMLKQIEEKLEAGFSCLKMKIGAIDFENELEIIHSIRKRFSESEITLRLDANGAFKPENALEKLDRLAQFRIHSIEQPIAQNQWIEMAQLCAKTPIPIALDEELIGIYDLQKAFLLDSIKPQYIILKPTLVGGFAMCDEWIELSEQRGIDWWITSALESNIGLNAICQYTYSKIQNRTAMPQGLGTGGLYLNNIDSPLQIQKGTIRSVIS